MLILYFCNKILWFLAKNDSFLQTQAKVASSLRSRIVLKSTNSWREFLKSELMNEHMSWRHTTVNAKTNYYRVCQGWECKCHAKNERNFFAGE